MAGGPGITSVIEAGMDASSLRAKVIANNLANMETPNYRRYDVRFEQFLAEAMDRGRGGETVDVQPEIIQPQTTLVDANGNDVVMEAEIGQMIQNGEKYKAYVRMLSKVYKQMDMAMGL
jgi:flagellar basal-body rod protein FlgB